MVEFVEWSTGIRQNSMVFCQRTRYTTNQTHTWKSLEVQNLVYNMASFCHNQLHKQSRLHSLWITFTVKLILSRQNSYLVTD